MFLSFKFCFITTFAMVLSADVALGDWLEDLCWYKVSDDNSRKSLIGMLGGIRRLVSGKRGYNQWLDFALWGKRLGGGECR